MDLFKNNSVNQSSVSNSQYTGRANASSAAQASSKVSTENLKPGDVIKGQITNIKDNQVTIRVNDGTSFTAKLSTGAEKALNIGMEASFEVESVSMTELYMKIKSDTYQFSQDVTIDKALEAAGLPKNDKNMEIVRELLNNGMSINKQSISNILAQSYLNKDISIQTLVMMTKNNIPLTPENMAQFDAYLKQEHQILNNINQLADNLPELLNLSYEADIQGLMDTHEAIFQLLDGGRQTQGPTLLLSAENRQELVQVLNQAGVLTGEMESSILNGTAKPSEVADLIHQIGKDNAGSENALGAGVQPAVGQSILEEPILHAVLKQHDEFLGQQTNLNDLLNSGQRDMLSPMIKDLPITQEQLHSIQSGNMSTDEFVNLIHNNLTNLSEDTLRELMTSKEYHSLLKDRLLENFTTTPKELSEDKNINELYNRMNQKLSDVESLLGTLKQNSGTNEALLQNAGSMKSNLNFMNTLNQMFTYFQLPLKFKNQTVHSELYVYKKKKDLKSSTDQLTVLLHLDMDYLKSLDIHISLTHNQVNTKFYLEDDEALQIVSDNMELLETALGQKGYTFTSETLMRERQTDIVKDLIEKDNPVSPVTRYGFDIRA